MSDHEALARFSFNQATAKYWPLPEVVDGCAAAGVPAVGLWREPVADHGLARTAALVRDAGVAVSSLCRGGFFGAEDWERDNRRAIDEAAALGAPALVLVCGGLSGRDLDTARDRVARSLDVLAPHALDAGVRLAVEPMHPMFCADRSVVATLDAALGLAERFPPEAVGVMLDTYHVWWDERVWELINRAGLTERIAGFQLADWILPLPEGVLTGRGLPGTGSVDCGRFVRAVDAAGYRGSIEVEVFNAELWAQPGKEVLRATISAYQTILAA